jgi:hypothetical protein
MKPFSSYLSPFVFLFLSLPLAAQFNSGKYDKNSFLIGSLNDYMGYRRTFTDRVNADYQRVDNMSLKHALFIDYLFSPDYTDIILMSYGRAERVTMYSPSLSRRIDDYYDYKPSGTRTLEGDTIYYGKVSGENFKTKKQKLSFLLGAYLRDGMSSGWANSIAQTLRKKPDEYVKVLYGFSVPNSVGKAQLCAKLLKELGSEEVEYVHRNTTIPHGHFIIFSPTKKMRKLMQEARRLEAYIESIRTDHVHFTADGTKYIRREVPKRTPDPNIPTVRPSDLRIKPMEPGELEKVLLNQ